MMADNDMLNEIITAKKSRRITFQTMMKNFQENMDLHLYPDEEIYSKLNETIKETDKDYKEQKRKFNKIIEAFCFDDAKMIFRKDDGIGDRGKDKSKKKKKNDEKNKPLWLFENDEKYIIGLLANYTSDEFKKFRQGKLGHLTCNYIVKLVDNFIKFAQKYVSDKYKNEYKQCKDDLYKYTGYTMLKTQRFRTLFMELEEDVRSVSYAETCFCNSRNNGLCKENCKSHLLEGQCTLTKNPDKDHFKNYGISVAHTCMRQNSYNDTFLRESDKEAWLDYAYDEFAKCKKKVFDVLNKISDIASEKMTNKTLDDSTKEITRDDYLMILNNLINMKIMDSEEYKTLEKRRNEIMDSHNISGSKEIVSIIGQLLNAPLIYRKQTLCSIMNENIDGSDNDDSSCNLSDEDIDNLLNEIDECVERHNQQAYQDAKTFYDAPHKRLQEAIREYEEENEK